MSEVDEMEQARHDRRDNMLIIGVVFAGTCLLASIFAWGMAARAESDARRVRATTAAAPAAATAAPPTIHLSEFQIQPATITVPADAALTVQNDGTMQHNLAVDGTSLATSMINPGGTAQLALTGLAPGSYTVYCQVPGHRDDGMHASLQVTAPTSGSGTSMNMGGPNLRPKRRPDLFRSDGRHHGQDDQGIPRQDAGSWRPAADADHPA